jgi:hypothetical protein
MSKNEISAVEADLLLRKMINEAIPVIAFYASREGVQARVRGYIEAITDVMGLQLATNQDAPETRSHFSIPMGNPVGNGCRFMYGDKRELPESVREEWAGELGEMALTIVLPYRSRLTLFFTI